MRIQAQRTSRGEQFRKRQIRSLQEIPFILSPERIQNKSFQSVNPIGKPNHFWPLRDIAPKGPFLLEKCKEFRS